MDVFLLYPEQAGAAVGLLGFGRCCTTVSKSMVSVAGLAAPCGPLDLSLSYRRQPGLPSGQEDALSRASWRSLVLT